MTARTASSGSRTTATSASQKVSATSSAAYRQALARYQLYLKHHPQAAAAAKKRKATKAKRGAPGAVVQGFWITANNDVEATCATVAIANCVLMQTGKRASDADVLALHRAGTARRSLWKRLTRRVPSRQRFTQR